MMPILEPQCMQAGNEWDKMHNSHPTHEWTGERDLDQTRKHKSAPRFPWVKARQWEKGAMVKKRERC